MEAKDTDKELVIDTKSSWTIDCDADWLKVSQHNGSNKRTILLTPSTNKSAGQRTATLTVKVNDKKKFEKKVTIIQKSFAVDLGLSVKWSQTCIESIDNYDSSWSEWRYPTMKELEELYNNCSYEWVNGAPDVLYPNNSPKNYISFHSNNGNSIQIPTSISGPSSFSIWLDDTYSSNKGEFRYYSYVTSSMGIGYRVSDGGGKADYTMLVIK